MYCKAASHGDDLVRYVWQEPLSDNFHLPSDAFVRAQENLVVLKDHFNCCKC